MENNPSKKYNIVFSEEKYLILGEILKKHGLEDLDERAFELDEKNLIPSPSIVILNAVSDIAEGFLLDKNLPELLKGTLNLTEQASALLSEDIKTKLIPICKKVLLDTDNISPQSYKTSPRIANVEENAKAMENAVVPEKMAPKIPPKISKKTVKAPALEEEKTKIPKNPITQQSLRQRGPDSYREPIE